MGYDVVNLQDNRNIRFVDDKGPFTVLEYIKDISVSIDEAQQEYFMSKMGIRKHQLLCDTNEPGIVISAGAMQWVVGDVKVTTGVRGAGDLVGKFIRGKVSGEAAIKPEYVGDGTLALEPTYKHLILWDISDWKSGVVLEDGLFLACQSSIKRTITARTTLSSAVAGGEGLFNLCLQGSGVFCVASSCPKEELITIDLVNDVLKIDGSFAIAWSSGLQFTVERSTKSLVGSAASGEGLVNVYRGTGRVVMMPLGNS